MRTGTIAALLAGAPLAAGCVTQQGWSNEDALAADSVEVTIDESSRPVEVEFHVAPGAVPSSVREAMDALHPGGRAVAAEKEFVEGVLYWEVTKEIDGRAVEAMFTPEGALHSEEIEVAAEDVPDAARAAVGARIGGRATKWEEIRDASRRLVEYHAKVTAEGKRYKVRVAPDGAVLAVLREVPAEIEVPVP